MQNSNLIMSEQQIRITFQPSGRSCACQAGVGPPQIPIYLFKIKAFMIPVS